MKRPTYVFLSDGRPLFVCTKTPYTGRLVLGDLFTLLLFAHYLTRLKVNDQLVAYATRFLAVRLKNYVRSQHRALKSKVQSDFVSAYSLAHTNILRLIHINININITQPGTK